MNDKVMNEPLLRDQLAASRMQVAALHKALTAAQRHLDNAGKLPEDVTAAIAAVKDFGEPDGVAIFASCRTLAIAARDPERTAELPGLAERIETLIAGHDGAV